MKQPDPPPCPGTSQQSVTEQFGALAERMGDNSCLLPCPTGETDQVTELDWPAMPTRISTCLKRRPAMEFLDWPGASGVEGRRIGHEDYIEWRVIRDGERIRRVEFTTELPEPWRVTAAHGPRQPQNPRERAFAGAMGPYPSRYSGEAAITCMIQPTNTLESLLSLSYAATIPRLIKDVVSGRLRCLTCEEAIPLMDGAAQQGRASDPILVERLARLAYEGRKVALEQPPGPHIRDVEHTRLRTPDGQPIPAEWFVFSRPFEAIEDLKTAARHRRLALEVPEAAGLCVSDLVDVATERPIRHGGEVADLVSVALRLRVSGAGLADRRMPEPTEVAEAVADPLRCDDLREHYDSFRVAHQR